MENIKSYFSFENESKLEGEEIYTLLTEVSILEAEGILSEQNIDVSNIYFKLLSQVQYLESDFERNQDEIAYIYHLIGYYVGLFLHPFNGDEVAINYINRAILIEKNEERVNKYKETIKMIKEEL
ncbi:hypothetical protein [Tissierella pigra]|uniref:Tetratricopeptide repeat protein n=1 Tax=Tissierella pigra TaxID=2607614 RepID=A0A6N7XX25_9FIRM|nr:hypothetical protein [Tissierella pigra]MSU01114.1 hypothetical protein [Tissierella pigra]